MAANPAATAPRVLIGCLIGSRMLGFLSSEPDPELGGTAAAEATGGVASGGAAATAADTCATTEAELFA